MGSVVPTPCTHNLITDRCKTQRIPTQCPTDSRQFTVCRCGNIVARLFFYPALHKSIYWYIWSVILIEPSIPLSDQWLPGSKFWRITTNTEWGFLTRLGWMQAQNGDMYQDCLLLNPYPLWIWYYFDFIGRYLFLLQNDFRIGLERNGQTGSKDRKKGAGKY
jgi:hypothetical protein